MLVVVVAVLTLLLVSVGAIPPPNHVNNCPAKGTYAWEHPETCENFFLCVNGTLTEERCPNGLVFNLHSKLYHFCDYYFNINCGDRLLTAHPIPSNECPWQYGLFERKGSCKTYDKCEAGYAIETPCEEGLAYNGTTHACDWPDQVYGCDSEEIVGFRCPAKSTGISARFEPFPRYLLNHRRDAIVVCVNYKPRLIKCGYGTILNEASLTCEEIHKEEY